MTDPATPHGIRAVDDPPGAPPKRDQIVDELRRRILAGTLPRGARLPEDELARDFGVSSTPVRSGRPFGEGPDPFDPDVD